MTQRLAALPDPRRRRFVQGLASGSALASLGFHAAASAQTGAVVGPQQVLRGTEFKLAIDATPVNFTGAARIATTVNSQLPTPILRRREGDTVTLAVTNHLTVTTSIHWHGIILPNEMGGIPGLTFDGIGPGETFVHRIPVKQSGTYWYHSHSRFQEQTGLYGPLVIEPRGGERFPADREYVVMLSDWTDEDPEAVRLSMLRS